MSKDLGFEEGDECGEDGCDGVLEIERDGECTCHIASPCIPCETAKIVCPQCCREVV